MRVKCFGCPTIFEADSADTIADAFVAHSRAAHHWSYPEQGLRNFARNAAEAVERQTGPTERVSAIAAVEVHPVTAERVEDWLRFFDHEAFSDNPDFASCYCLQPNVPATPELPERAWRDSRSTTCGRLHDGSTFGYLAYVDGRVAGWVNASLRADSGLFRDVDPEGPAPRSVVAVSCFVVAPPFRRHGVAGALLDRVITEAPSRGADWIEAYPHTEPEPGDGGHFRGPRSLFDARGFTAVAVNERFAVMRRAAG